ncbi:hypothetical protein COBT_001746 [Conglomerata obtusa]
MTFTKNLYCSVRLLDQVIYDIDDALTKYEQLFYINNPFKHNYDVFIAKSCVQNDMNPIFEYLHYTFEANIEENNGLYMMILEFDINQSSREQISKENLIYILYKYILEAQHYLNHQKILDLKKLKLTVFYYDLGSRTNFMQNLALKLHSDNVKIEFFYILFDFKIQAHEIYFIATILYNIAFKEANNSYFINIFEKKYTNMYDEYVNNVICKQDFKTIIKFFSFRLKQNIEQTMNLLSKDQNIKSITKNTFLQRTFISSNIQKKIENPIFSFKKAQDKEQIIFLSCFLIYFKVILHEEKTVKRKFFETFSEKYIIMNIICKNLINKNDCSISFLFKSKDKALCKIKSFTNKLFSVRKYVDYSNFLSNLRNLPTSLKMLYNSYYDLDMFIFSICIYRVYIVRKVFHYDVTLYHEKPDICNPFLYVKQKHLRINNHFIFQFYNICIVESPFNIKHKIFENDCSGNSNKKIINAYDPRIYITHDQSIEYMDSILGSYRQRIEIHDIYQFWKDNRHAKQLFLIVEVYDQLNRIINQIQIYNYVNTELVYQKIYSVMDFC